MNLKNMICLLYVSYKSARRIVNYLDPICVYSRQPILTFDCEHLIAKSLIPKKEAHNDLHNLFKCTSSINRSKGNKKFTEDSSLKYNFFEVSCPSSRATISRTCMYYMTKYCTTSKERDFFFNRIIDEELLWKWYDLYGQHLIDTYELIRNYEIEKIQGNSNPFVKRME